MFFFGRRKKASENDEVFQEIEKIVHKLDQDGSGRIRIVDLEAALQRFDETGGTKSESDRRVKSFSE